MKIDPDYLKRLLETAQASPSPALTILDFEVAGIPYDSDEFEFRMQILADQRLIVRDDGDPGSGCSRASTVTDRGLCCRCG